LSAAVSAALTLSFHLRIADMSTPSVPPRPQRAQAGHTTVKHDMPSIPPRPIRNVDPSPDRAARSPLNDPSTVWGQPKTARARSSQDLPRRPPSVVSLGNDIGHDGDEYSSFDQLPDEARVSASDEQTRNVSADLPMHQPKASVPQSTAKRQIQTVTGTDSTQAAAAGIGQSRPADDVHKQLPGAGGESRRAPSTEPYNVLRTKSSFNRSSSSLQPLERSTSRTGSIHGDDREHGIPEIGRQVPLLAMAGDVQAPSPAAGSMQHMPGIGFFNDGSSRNHVRKRSSRQEFGPPDSYGLHHDYQDQFEKEWARKHPQEAAKEGYYAHHLPKPVSALTDEQLNRLVHQSDEDAIPRATGTPDEHDADDFLTRVSSAAPSPAPEHKPRPERLHPSDARDSSEALASPRRSSHRGLVDDEHEHEHADGTPILASDELLKRPSSSYMQAAVTPDPDHIYDDHYDSDTGRGSRRNSTHATSRPSSRPSSVHGQGNLQGYHGGSLHRYISHEEPHHSGSGTPLEEIEEYEPLFPEDEKEVQKRVFKKRPELAQHHFPSHDVWEDTPSSLQYSTTVSTPEVEQTEEIRGLSKGGATTFETPEQEAQRRAQNDQENNMMSSNKTFVKPQFKSSVAADMHRPGAHRFPSSDVWEDSPDSFNLVNTTTVSSSQDDEQAADDARPSIPTRPQRKSKLAEEDKPPQEPEQRDVKSPPIPAKPSIPSRPVRPARQDQLDGAESVEAKSKPPVPARPGGEKIAAMKAGFMSDLNNRLKLGPQGPPKKEPEPEVEEESKAPLADARKSRAKGPARRKPAAAPVSADRRSSAAFAFSPLIHCWSIDEEDELQVHHEQEQGETAKGAVTVEAEKTPADENAETADPAEEIASQIVHADKPHEEASKHRGSIPELKTALADAGAAPSSFAEGEEEKVLAVKAAETEAQ